MMRCISVRVTLSSSSIFGPFSGLNCRSEGNGKMDGHQRVGRRCSRHSDRRGGVRALSFKSQVWKSDCQQSLAPSSGPSRWRWPRGSSEGHREGTLRLQDSELCARLRDDATGLPGEQLGLESGWNRPHVAWWLHHSQVTFVVLLSLLVVACNLVHPDSSEC